MSIDEIREGLTALPGLTASGELTRSTMPQKKVQTIIVRKIDASSQTDKNLVKIVAESGKFKSINPQNYEDELANPLRAFYLLEDEQGAPAAVISVVAKDSDYASFTTDKIMPIRNAIVTEAGYAFQHGKRYYQALKQIILYAIINQEYGAVLGLPALQKDQYLVTKVTGPKKSDEPGEDYAKGSVRSESKSIVDVDKKLGFATAGYSPDHYGPIHVATYKTLKDAFSRQANIPPLEIAGNALLTQIILDAEGKVDGFAKKVKSNKANIRIENDVQGYAAAKPSACVSTVAA